MAIYKMENDKIVSVNRTSFSSVGILERKHLQAALINNISVISPQTLVIDEEFSDWEESNNRVDILGISKDASLVIIELKRDDTGKHMELQAIRYAAMLSSFTFEKACEVYQAFLEKNSITKDSRQEILSFLEWPEPKEEEFAINIRIVLASADFSKEITTTVLWLNENGLDIRCVRLMPYLYEKDVLLDVQQVIPLPEAEEYQVKLREKNIQREASIMSGRDYTKYLFNGKKYNKRGLVLAVVREYVTQHPETTLKSLVTEFPKPLHKRLDIVLDAANKDLESRREKYFSYEDQLITLKDGTRIAVCNQWGLEGIQRILKKAKEIGFSIQEIKDE